MSDAKMVKRKAHQGAGAGRPDSVSIHDRPLKRQKHAKPEKSSAKSAKKAASKPAEPIDTGSVLKIEEKSFPRGGSNVLSSLEHRQISIQATKDVLFEQSGAKRPAADTLSELDNASMRSTSPKPRAKKKKKKKKKKKPVSRAENGTEDKRQFKIEGLSYKRLIPGTLVLGQITQITSRDVALSLPNNLTGYVPLTEISDHLNKRVKLLLQQEEEEEVDSNEEDFADVDLKKIFSVGQYLRAYVTNAGAEASGKKRIDLSLNPRLANAGITRAELEPNVMVQASVASVEDHGLVMDLALDDKKVKGFLSSNEFGDGSLSDMEEGAVLLCIVTGIGSDGRVVKLSANLSKMGNLKKHVLSTSQSIKSFVPGTAVEMLITDLTPTGIAGKIMGMVDATADIFHCGFVKFEDLEEKYSAGSKVKARVVFSLPREEGQALGVSLLNHTVSLNVRYGDAVEAPTDVIPLSSVVEHAQIVRVLPALGLFLSIAGTPYLGFAHISNISESKIDKISIDSGPFKIGSTHNARVLGFCAMDGNFTLSLQPSVIEQPFLRVEDIDIGQLVKGTVEKLHINEHGVNLLVKLAEGIVGLVPVLHLADIHLEHPERKFREGMFVKARVLSTDVEKRTVRLTLKKTLVNSDVDIWSSYDEVRPSAKSLGTIIKILSGGAVVQFFGDVRGFLPVSEMSEAYIDDPRKHFKIGQVVNVSVLDVDPENRKMTVSCKNPNSFSPEQLSRFEKLEIGSLVKATVTNISSEFATCNINESLKAVLRVQHFSDGSISKNETLLKKLRVGQILNDLLVLNKDHKRRLIVASQKPTLIKEARAGALCTSFDQLQPGKRFAGFVRNITSREVFVEFGGGVSGLLLPHMMEDDMRPKPKFGVELGQSLSVLVFSVDEMEKKAMLAMKDYAALGNQSSAKMMVVRNAMDGVSNSHEDFSLGKQTTAIVTSVKATQLNVQMADNVHGRVDASEVFDKWDDIKDRKQPLCSFRAKQKIEIRVIGIHDVKSKRFLPISHRHSSHNVYELSARNMSKDNGRYVLTLDKLMVGDKVIGIVNNHDEGSIWVNLSPSVRGRVRYTDLIPPKVIKFDPIDLYPIGSAIILVVHDIDLNSNKLNLTIPSTNPVPKSLDALSVGDIYPAQITRVSDSGLEVRFADSLHGTIPLVQLADDYGTADPAAFEKNQLLPRAAVVHIDKPNKRLYLSLRPSVINANLSTEIIDRQISSSADVKVNDKIRGFVRHVSDKGVFINLGATITGFVPVAELSDCFIKDWKEAFTVDNLVTGKVISVDSVSDHIKMSLKESLLKPDYVPPLQFEDLKPEMIVSAKVRKVEPYGVFLVVDGSANVSGLCHKSEMANNRIEDPTKLYDAGDVVKALVLKVDTSKKRINFSLKASRLKIDVDESGSETEEHGVDGDIDEEMQDTREITDADEGTATQIPVGANQSVNSLKRDAGAKALAVGGFDWSGGMDTEQTKGEQDHQALSEKKRKKKKPTAQEDHTGEMDKFGPQGNADFERLLLSQPNNANVWIQYMAFELKLGEVDKAREIAERGLKSINPLDQDEKKDLWIAYLNFENEFGSDENVDQVFLRACEYNDKDDMHERLASIFIASGKQNRAEELFSRMTQIKRLSATQSFWLNYMTFLMTTANRPEGARTLLRRATQSVPEVEHRSLTARLGALEFRSPNGDSERGRTIFEGLLSAYPKHGDLWDMYVDMESSHGNQDNARKLYERMANSKMKKKRAKFVFKKWLAFENDMGNWEDVERVTKLAEEYVKMLANKDTED